MDGGLQHCRGGGDQKHSQEKEMQKGKVVVWGGCTNSWEKKRSEKAKRKGKVKAKGMQSRPTLWPHALHTDRGILRARTLEWAAFPFSRASSQPRDRTQASHIAGGFFSSWAVWVEFQRTAKRERKALLTEQCQETEAKSRMGNTRDLSKKVRDAREHFIQRWTWT